MPAIWCPENHRQLLLGSLLITAAEMTSLLRGEKNPRADNASPHEMIFCPAEREAKVLIRFDGAEEAVTARDSVYRARYQWRMLPA